MVRKLIAAALDNPLIVVILTLVLAGAGSFAVLNVNVEAYPDPAPAIIEVVAQFPGASAEEVERLVTIPLEVTLAGMPGLQYTRSKSLAGLAHLRNQFQYGFDYNAARQEVINRLQFTQGLPSGVTPQISPMTPTGELIRYTVRSPRDSRGREIYALRDLKSIQDWTLQREFGRLPGVAGIANFGGQVKRYEVRPDPEQLKRYGITLKQLQDAIANSNANVGAGYLVQGGTAVNVRGVGLLGRGADPMQQVLALPDPFSAARLLRDAERERIEDIRNIVVAAVNNVPVHVHDLAARGPLGEGVAVGFQPRQGRVSISRPRLGAGGEAVLDDKGNRIWDDEEDKVQGVVLMRKGEATTQVLRTVKEKLAELNEEAGRLPPGVQVVPHFDLTGLLQRTTHTVNENLVLGIVLVTLILLMFLANVRCALIVAVNIPLALLFAFSVLFLRGRSANLLSIGAIDFGIIVDSSVIIVENIYRQLSAEGRTISVKEAILRASHEVEKPLFFSTAVMVCALLPLLTMRGVEGQIFGPMADTYAFALGGALLLSLTVSPVLCLIFLRNLKPAGDNFLVRGIKAAYLWQLRLMLEHRLVALGSVVLLVAVTVAALPQLGREFMPELEEGNLYIRGTFPVNISLEETADRARIARRIIRSYPEVALVASQVGRPDDGTDPTGFYNLEFTVPLHPESEWPHLEENTGWRRWVFGPSRARTKQELIQAMNAELDRTLVGVDWNFSQYIRDNVMESLSGVKGDNSVKIIGPDLDELERLAERLKGVLDTVPGVENAGIFRIKGQPTLEFTVDRDKCRHWNVSVNDVENAVKIAVGGQAFSQMIEGERTFDITLRWPEALRGSEQAILDIPIDVTGNQVTQGNVGALAATPFTGPSSGVSSTGTSMTLPALLGNTQLGSINYAASVPRLRLRHLVTPVNADGQPDPHGAYLRTGASTIYREQGKRLIAVKFSVRGRDLAGTVADAQERTRHLFTPPYRAEWSGEFRQMEEAERRLVVVVLIAFALIFLLIYLAFRSLLDTLVVLSGAALVTIGGIWALLLSGTHFNISAAVGFISILGVAVMNGLILVSSFNALRAEGVPLHEALVEGIRKRVRPVTMTTLTAILGLLPAALSTKIGSQSQKPLAIVVVGGMLVVQLLTNLVPLLYSFYGERQPPEGSGGMAH